MDVLLSLLKLLDEGQKKALHKIYVTQSKAEEKLLVHLLEGHTDEKWMLKKLKVTPATFSKVQTLAKDILSAYISQSLPTPLDEVTLVQKLLLIGEIKTATKFYNALEKDFEKRQKWQLLDALYKEGFRLSQMRGDLKMMKDVIAKRNYCIDKYAGTAKLYGEVMYELVRSEKYEGRDEDAKVYLKKIQSLNKRAYENGNHALIHNTLTLLYNHYARFFNEPDSTWDIVQKVQANRLKYEFAMDGPTTAISRIIPVNFLCIYHGYGSPEELLGDTMKHIDKGGTIARVNIIYALLGYFLAEEKKEQAKQYLLQLEAIQDNTHFAAFKSVVLAILAFLDNDDTSFDKYYTIFLQQPNHSDLPDSEVVARILELILLYRKKEDWLYKSKADALRVYFNRNLNKERYAEEYDLLTFLITPSKKNRGKLGKMHASKYRNSRFLVKHVLANIAAA